MKHFTPNNQEITTFEEWANIFLGTKKEKHWKEGRSAYSIADFIFHHDGQAQFENIISSVLGDTVSFETAMIEKESRFDAYGHGREHDLGIKGSTASGKSLFVGLEVKVDESFGERIKKSYLKSKANQLSGVTTNAPARIEELIKAIFKAPDEAVFDLRYQLFYAVMGTLAEQADISVLYVAVFKTKLYNELIGLDNFKDYMAFMIKAGAEKIKTENNERTVHRLVVGEKEIVCIYENFYL
jgi:Domain of unknown function (DUF6946)